MEFSYVAACINFVVYIITVFVNYWYMDDQQKVADAHSTPITPDSFAQSIWIIIYMYLFFFMMVECVYPETSVLSGFYYTIHFRLLVMVALLCNIVWVLTFSFISVGVAFIPLFILWLSLGLLWLRCVYIREVQGFISVQYICSSLPLTLYFAWITIATTGNVAIIYQTWNDGQMLSRNLSALGLTIILVIAISMIVYLNEFTGGLVFVWALYWIVHKEDDKADESYDDDLVSYAASLGIAILVSIYIVHAIFLFVRYDKLSVYGSRHFLITVVNALICRKFMFRQKIEAQTPLIFPLSPPEKVI